MAILKNVLFVLLVLCNSVVLNGVFVLGSGEKIAFLQRSSLYAISDTRAIFCLLPQGNVLWKTYCNIPSSMTPHAALWYLRGQKTFLLRGVHSGPMEIDGFQNHPGHSSLSAQTFSVWKEEYASMTNVHPLLCKTSSHRAFVSAVPMRCLDSILQWLKNHNGFLGKLFWIPVSNTENFTSVNLWKQPQEHLHVFFLCFS